MAQAFPPARDGLESPSYTLPHANGTKCQVASSSSYNMFSVGAPARRPLDKMGNLWHPGGWPREGSAIPPRIICLVWGRQPAAHLTKWGISGILVAGPGREALFLLVSLLLGSKFYRSMRPSSRWVLLTRILFVTCHHLGQQTQGASWWQGEFSLTARLLTSSGARDSTSLGRTTTTTPS